MTTRTSHEASNMTTCRYCAEEIRGAALVCPHCGRSQPGTLSARWAMESPMKWLHLITAGVASAAFWMALLALLTIQTVRDYGDNIWAPAAETEEGENVIERRRDWRNGDAVPDLDPNIAAVAVNGNVTLELDRADARQLRLEVEVATDYRITVDGLGELDPFLYLFRLYEDQTLGLITTDDDSGEGTNAAINERLERGVYVLAVEDFFGGGGQCEVQVTAGAG